MNRAAFLMTLAGSAMLLKQEAKAENRDEALIYDILDALVDAQFTLDFRRMAPMLHPHSVKLFRALLSARFDQILQVHSMEQIQSVSGLAAHPKDLPMSDSEFFVSACEEMGKREPAFVGDPKFLPLNVHGTIFERDSTAYVLFSFSGAVHTERTDVDYVQPLVYNFRREGKRWLLRSSLYANRIMDQWWRNLAAQKVPMEKTK